MSEGGPGEGFRAGVGVGGWKGRAGEWGHVAGVPGSVVTEHHGRGKGRGPQTTGSYAVTVLEAGSLRPRCGQAASL